MAKARAAEPVDAGPSLYEEAVEWYRTELAKPAPPPEEFLYPPELIGPTWKITLDGTWHLPEHTLGWQVLGWCAEWLQHGKDQPWRFTLEQARFLLWWYAVDSDGRFLFRDGVLQRLKGWGKDPIGACLSMIEMYGPCRFSHWEDGEPVATDNPEAWVQTAAVSLEQTKNTMRLFPNLVTSEAQARYGIMIGKETVYGGDGRLVQAVTSSPSTLEGARATFVLMNETQHWTASNGGHDMAAVISRNATKSADGAARTLRITNAYEPSTDSVAQVDREAYDLSVEGGSLTTGLLYDSIEAPPEAPLTAEAAPHVVRAIRGDSVWLDVERIVQAILDTREPPSRSRRFWYNQIVAAEDAWVVPQHFDLLLDKEIEVSPRDEVVMFFDGSKSDDASGLVGCRLSDGHVLTLGMWQAPPGERGKNWLAPRDTIDQAVERAIKDYNVVAFWGDPSHVLDDETQDRYWDPYFDEWHRKHKDKFRLWATPGQRGHSVMWDMTSSARTMEFTAAAEVVQGEIEAAEHGVTAFTWDGDGRLQRHVRNARQFPNKHGVSVWKGSRRSKKKIDLAVCMIGARMLRRNVLNAGQTGKRSGKVWFPNAR